jgi:hypothetical protein
MRKSMIHTPNNAMHTTRRQQMRINELLLSDTGFAAGVRFQRRSVILFR